MARREFVLPASGFQQLCGKASREEGDAGGAVTDPNEQRALLRLLHDLGVVVAHGLSREAPAAMREITLLDPNWLTGAIYRILNEPRLRDQGGEFERAQLGDWLDQARYPPEWHEFILTMMQDPDVGLCFELPDSKGRYLVPEALPPSAPYYANWPKESLRFRFRYDSLPRRLIPSFIVRAHANLAQPPTRWRTGAVLEAAKCPILILGDTDRKTIDIAVAGSPNFRRSALNIVLNYLDDIHALNPEIGAQARVPLLDRTDSDVSYEHLLKLEERYGSDHTFDPEGADRQYTVRELLDGVRRDPVRYDEARDWHDNIGGSQRNRPGGDAPFIPDQRPPGGPAENTGLAAALTSWRYFSLACGVVAALFVVVMMLLPSNEWRAYIGLPVAVGVLVVVLVLREIPPSSTGEY
jgi:hypothetical protein